MSKPLIEVCVDSMESVCAAAEGLSLTLHRAFDVCADAEAACASLEE